MTQYKGLQEHSWSDLLVCIKDTHAHTHCLQGRQGRKRTPITLCLPHLNAISSSFLSLLFLLPVKKKNLLLSHWHRAALSHVHPLQSRPGSAFVVTWEKIQTGRPITAQQSSICQPSDRNTAQPNIWLPHKSLHLTLTSLSCMSN